jgi:hypothetical protein
LGNLPDGEEQDVTKMDAADHKANAVKDLLYTQGVRTNEYTHLEVYPAGDRKTVTVSVYRNHYDCESCRSKTLGSKIIEGLKHGVAPACTQCRIHNESMEFEQRRLLGRALAVLRREFTVTDEYTGSVVATADIAV